MAKQTIGYELEFEGSDVCSASPYFSKFGSVVRDGSLRGGFELSSKVESFDKFRSYSNLDSDWQKLFDAVNAIPTESTERTGMHVHVGRESLGTTSERQFEVIKKLNSLIYSNRNLCELVGGRPENRTYCQFIVNTNAEIVTRCGDKYRFLNVGGCVTIEFRFFKVPKSLKRFLTNMQFVIALCDFCIKDKRTVLAFVRENRKNELLAFIKKGNYLDLNMFLLENEPVRLEPLEIDRLARRVAGYL